MAASIGSLVFETKLDRSGLNSGLRDIAGTRASIDVDFNFDDRSMARMEQRLKGMNLGLKVTVDDRALTDLNRHLDMKEQHFDRVQRKFNQSPLTPKVDLSQLKELDAVMSRLKDVQINVRLAGGAKGELKALADAVAQIADVKVDAKVTVDRTALDNIKDKTITVRTDVIKPKADTAELIKSIADAAKQDYQVKIRARVEVDRAAFDAVKDKTVKIKADGVVTPEVDASRVRRGIEDAIGGAKKSVDVTAIVKVDRSAYDSVQDKSVKINAVTSGVVAPDVDTSAIGRGISAEIAKASGVLQVGAIVKVDRSEIDKLRGESVTVKAIVQRIEPVEVEKSEVIKSRVIVDRAELDNLRAPSLDLKVSADLTELEALKRELGSIERLVDRLADSRIGVKATVAVDRSDFDAVRDKSVTISANTIAPALDESKIKSVQIQGGLYVDQSELSAIEQRQLKIKAKVERVDDAPQTVAATVKVNREELDRIKPGSIPVDAKVVVDRSEYDGVKGKTVSVDAGRVKVDRSEYDAIKDKKVEVEPKVINEKGLTGGIRGAISGAVSDGFKAVKNFDLLGIVATPFKLVFGTLGAIGKTVIDSVVKSVSNGLGRGISESLETSIGGTIRKLGDLGERSGNQVTTDFFGNSKDDLKELDQLIDQQYQSAEKKRSAAAKPATGGKREDAKREIETVEKTKLELDLTTIAQIKARVEAMDLSLTVMVDDSRLTDLNKHLSLKEEHFGQVQRKFDKPLKPSIDISQAQSLDKVSQSIDGIASSARSASGSIDIDAKVKVDRSEMDQARPKKSDIVAPKTEDIPLSTTVKVNRDELDRIKSGAIPVDAKVMADRSELDAIDGKKAAVEVDKKVEHTVESSKFESLFDRTVQSFGKTGDGIGDAIAKRVGATKIETKTPGGLIGGAIGNVFRGVSFSIGEKVTAGLSGKLNATLEQIGASAERYVTSKAGKAVVQLSKDLGYSSTRELRQDVGKVGGVIDSFVDPVKSRKQGQKIETAVSTAAQSFFVNQTPLKEVGRQFIQDVAPPTEGLKEAGLRVAGAGLRAVSPILRVNKDVNLAKAAKLADELALEIKITEEEIAQIKAYNSIALTIGGLNKAEGTAGEETVKPLVQRIAPGAYVEGVSNEYRDSGQAPAGIDRFLQKFNKNLTTEKVVGGLGLGGVLSPGIQKFLDTAVFQGATPEVIQQAARVKALRMKGVDAPISAIGYSAGATDAADLVNISNRIGGNITGVGLGGPIAGLTQRRDKAFTSVLGQQDYIYAGLFAPRDSRKATMAALEKRNDEKSLQDFAPLAAIAPLVGQRLPGTQVLPNVGFSHKLSAYLADPKVQGIIGQGLPNSVAAPTSTNSFANQAKGSRVGTTGTRALDYVFDASTGGVDDDLAQLSVALKDRSATSRDKAAMELKKKAFDYRRIAQGASGAVKSEIEALADVLDSGVATLEGLANSGGEKTPEFYQSRNKLAQKTRAYNALRDKSLDVRQGEFFDAQDREAEIGSAKQDAEEFDTRVAPIQAKAAAALESPDVSRKERMRVEAIQSEIENQAAGVRQSIEAIANPSLPLDDVYAAGEDIVDRLNSLKKYGKALAQVEADIADRVANETPSQRRKRLNSERVEGLREQFKQGIKEAPQKIKEAVFSPDRNIDINTDAIRDRAEDTGIAIYESGKMAAQTLDKVVAVWGEFADSSIGMGLVGGMSNAANALGAFTKGVYNTLEGFETAAFAALPYGNEVVKPAAKALLGPGLALGAASALPGIGPAVQGAAALGSDFANFALSPVTNAIGGSIIGQGTEAINALLPQMQVPEVFGQPLPGAQQAIDAINGVRSGAIETLTAATNQGLNVLKSGVAELATVFAGGKAVQAGAGAIAAKLPGADAAPALLPGADRFALPGAKPVAAPNVQIIGLDDGPLALPQAKSELAPPPQRELRDLTKAQLTAVARQNKIDVRKRDNKDDIARKLEQQLGYSKLDPIIAEIDSTFDREGRPVGGYNIDREKALIKQFEAKEKAINEKIRESKRLSGRNREKLLEQIAFESEAVRREIDQTKTEALSGPTAGKLAKLQGRVQSNYNNRPEQIEARDNRIAQAQQAFGRTSPVIEVQAQPSAADEGATFSRATLKSDGVFKKLADRLRSILPKTEQQIVNIQTSYAAITDEVFAFSEAVGQANSDIAPKLTVDTARLKGSGDDALYDAKANTIVISKSLEDILRLPADELHKYSDKLKPLIHELRHAVQTGGGNLSIENAAKGVTAQLAEIDGLTPMERRQAEASTAQYKGPESRRGAVLALEADAVAFERNTPQIVDGAASRVKNTNLGQTKSTSMIGRKMADIRDLVENVVGDMVDRAKLTLKGQKDQIIEGRAGRYLKRTTKIEAREQAAFVADAAASVRQADSVKAPTTGERIELRDPSEGELKIPSVKQAFEFVTGAVSDANQALADRLTDQAKELADDARQAIAAIKETRIESQRALVENPETFNTEAPKITRLQGLEDRATAATKEIDTITSKGELGVRDRGRLRDLRSEIASVYKEIGRPISGGSVGDGILSIGDRVSGLISKFKGLGVALLALPFAFEALQGLKQFGKDSIDAAVNADRLRTSLAFSTGSAAKGDKALQFVADQSDTFGVSLRSSREGFAQLKAATKGSKIEGAQTDELFTGFSQASTTLGISGEAQNRAFTALQQIASKGKLSAEELRGQLSEALPGSFAIAARSIGVTETELNKLLETGAIVSDEFLPKFAKQLKSEFGAGAEDASKNLQSSLFRLDNAFLGLQEASGKAISPLVQTGAQAATGALNLLSKSIGVIGPLLLALSGQALLSFGKELLKIPAIAEKVAGAGGIIKGGFASFAGAIGPTVALTGAAIIAGKVFEGLQETFAIDPAVERFKKNSASISNEMDKLVGKAKKTGDVFKGLGNPENKGLDVTYGLGDALGIGKVKTDDLIDQINKKPKNIGDVLKSTAASVLGGPLVQVAAAVGFKSSDLQKKREKEAEDQALKDIDNVIVTGGEEKSSQLRLDSLKKAKEIDDKSAALRSELAKIKGKPGQEGRATQIQDELKTLGNDRKDAIFNAEAQAAQAKAALREVEERRKALAEKPPSKERNDGLKQLDDRASKLRERIQQFRDEEIKIGVNVDPIRKMITALADLDDKLSTIQAKADLKLNISLAGNAKTALDDFSSNQFADQDKAIADAKAQAERAAEVFDQSQAAIEATKKDLGGEDVTRALSQIGVGSTGRTLSIDSSEEDLKTAKKGASEQDKELIERVDNFRQAREKLPVLDKEKSESALQRRQAEQAGSVARLDDKAQVRDLANAKSAGDRQIALNKAIVSNSFKSDEELAMKRAELEKQAVQERGAAVQEKISLLEAEKAKGVLSAEEYTKRRRALAQEEIGIAADASNAEVSIKQAANAKILADLQRSKRDRDLATKETTNAAQIQLAKDELNPNISDERLAVKSAEVNLTSTRSELSNAKTELEELNKAFASGALNQEQYNDRAAELKGNISDLGVKEAQGELAVRKAINQELLKQYDRAKATRELEARVANNAGRSALLGRQLRGSRKLESEDVAIESAKLDSAATDRQTQNAQRDLADLNEQFAKGLIKVGEFEDKSKELKGTLSDLGVQKLTNELAILEAQNAKTLKSFERLNAEANAKLEVKTFTRSDGAKRTQFQTGEVVGLGGAAEQSAIERDAISGRIKLRTAEIAGIKRLVQQRVLTESEGRDRILGIESDIRSQRTALLDSQIAEYNRVTDGKIAAIKRASDAEVRAFDKQKTQLQVQSNLIEKQSSILNARKELAAAISSGRVSALEGRSNQLGEQRNLAARLRTGDVGRNERREIERQIGRSNPFVAGGEGRRELRLLEQQQSIAREIENEKLSGLEEQQKFARESLKLEERRLEIAQKIAEIEARSGEVTAKSAAATAKIELARAKRTGDRDQIAAAEEGVAAANQGVELAGENSKAVRELRNLGEEESRIKRQTLGVQQRNELGDLFRGSNAEEKKRQLERARLGDELGLDVAPKAIPYALRPTSADTNKALYQDQGETAADNEKYQSEQLQTMKAMLQVAIETSKKLDKPAVNNFNGGDGAIDQYVAFKKQEQAAKARE